MNIKIPVAFWFITGILHYHAGWIRFNNHLIFQYKAFNNPPLFSERYGYVKYINLGLIRVRFCED